MKLLFVFNNRIPTQCTEKWKEQGVNRGAQLIFAPGPPCWLAQPFFRPMERNSCRILFKAPALYSLCAAAYLPSYYICDSHTPPLTCHSPLLYISCKHTCAHEQKANKDGEVPPSKHRKQRHKPQQTYTPLNILHTTYVKSCAKKMHTTENVHTYTHSLISL